MCSTQYSLTSWAAMLSSCSARLFSGGAPNRSVRAWATAASCSGRSSHRKGWREFFRRPVSEMSNTYRSRGFSRELSTRAMPLEPRRTYVPEVIFRTGRCVRALGEDHKLLVEGVLIQPGGGGEKCRPSLPAIRQVGGGVAGHRRIKFQVTHHRHCPRCQNPGTVPARQMLHRSWRTALQGQSR